MTPYLETRALPVGRRRSLAILAAALMVPPAGALLPGAAQSSAVQILAVVALLLLAPLLGLGFSRGREVITVGEIDGMIERRITGELPDPRARVDRWPISSARLAELDERGTVMEPRWGVLIHFDGDEPPLRLRAWTDRDHAQDTVDHLVLLGIPGTSRQHQRDALHASLNDPARGPYL